jgi:hypothetical protein
MKEIELTEAEQKILDDLYGLPKEGYFKKPTHIWIIEWLSSSDRHTGRELHEWMQERNYSFRSVYWECFSKDKVLAAIERAATHTEHHGIIPLIHFEAHGSEDGLSDSREGENVLTWDELTKPLQRLNLATRCNLIVLVAACKGYAGLLAFANTKSYRESRPTAPALVIAGPVDDLLSKQLLEENKEFYRRLSEKLAELDNAIMNASNECSCKIDRVVFTNLLYEELLEHLIILLREDQRKTRINRLREQFLKINNKGTLSPEEERRLEEARSPAFWAKTHQQQWDTMFMIDIFPENQEMFGVNWLSVTKKILDIQKSNSE